MSAHVKQTADNPTSPARRGRSEMLSIPLLQTSRPSLAFGKMDSDYTVTNFTLHIDIENTLAELTYLQLSSIVSVELTETKEEFVRMWNTLMLKRAQDCYKFGKSSPSPSALQRIRAGYIPGALYDLLVRIGNFTSNVTGDTIHVIPPPIPKRKEDIPNYFTISPQLVAKWNNDMYRMKGLYQMEDFPSLDTIDDKMMTFTMVSSYEDDIRCVRSYTDEPTPEDGIVHLVNGKTFEDNNFLAYEGCHIKMTQQVSYADIATTYVGSYVIESNS